MSSNVQNLLRFNKNILWIGGIFIAVLFGLLVGITYPNWYQQIPFKDYIPEYLSPPGSFFQFQVDNNRVIRTVEESVIIEAVNKASPAVVSIVASTVSLDPSQEDSTSQQGIGTGFIVRSDGIILTASHVVSDRSINYKVVTSGEKTYDVKKIDIDPSLDFAILKVEAKDLPILNLGDSDSVQTGQLVLAIGNALGRFTNSVTHGIVSGIGRGVTPTDAAGISQGTLENVIQTDAALNPGNSGGPLLDLNGSAIGINFATTVGAENIGFVVPINSVKNILEEYYVSGKIVRPFLGISYVMIDRTTALLQSIPQGAFIRAIVSGSPASDVDLRPGDIITKLGDQDLGENSSLANVISKFKVGDSVDLEVWRDGKTIETSAKLVEAPQ